MSAIRDGQLVGTESVEEHLANCRQILWSLRDGLSDQLRIVEEFDGVVAQMTGLRGWIAYVTAADMRIEAALREYAKEKGTP